MDEDTYTHATASPYRLEGAVDVVRRNSEVQAVYDNGRAHVSTAIPDDGVDEAMRKVARLVDAAHAATEAGRTIRAAYVRDDVLTLVFTSGRRMVCVPSAGTVVILDESGERPMLSARTMCGLDIMRGSTPFSTLSPKDCRTTCTRCTVCSTPDIHPSPLV